MSITAKEMNSGQKLIMTVITFAPNWWRKNSLSKTKIESADNNEHRDSGPAEPKGDRGTINPPPHFGTAVELGDKELFSRPKIVP